MMNGTGHNIRKALLAISICIASSLIVFFIIRVNPILGFAVSLAPLAFLFTLLFLFKPFWGYIFAFTINYFNAGISRYISAYSPGIIFDMILVFLLFSLLVNTLNQKVKWKDGLNVGTILSFIWVIYCVMEFFNPYATSNEAWFATVRGVALYLFMIILFTTIVCDKWDKVQKILLIWGMLSIFGVAKGLMQRYRGFDDYEMIWLYQDGGAVTHIILTGIRYFSFFSDASSFGGTMGQSAIVFLCLFIFEPKKWKKVFYATVTLLTTYGLILSGTRAAFVIPLVGLATFIFLSKNIKTIVLFGALLVAMVVFFRFTYIGQGNAIIRRIRSTFYATEDASFIVRLQNQQKLRAYMKDKPFGGGIGHGGVKAARYTRAFISTIPTDSWYVMIWVETGIVGLILNLLIMLSLLGYGAFQILFRIKNKPVRGVMAALISGSVGIMVASYGNEILGQFPTGFIVYASIGIIIMGEKYDKQYSEQNNAVICNN